MTQTTNVVPRVPRATPRRNGLRRRHAHHAQRAGQPAEQRGRHVEGHVVAGRRERMLDLDLLGLADPPVQGEQVQADQQEDDQGVGSGQGEDDPPPEAGFPQHQHEEVADASDEPDRAQQMDPS